MTTNKMKDNGISGGIYGMAFIGAAVYFIQHRRLSGKEYWAFLKPSFGLQC
jgi:hypothetical protein